MQSLRKGLTIEEQAQIDNSFALANRIAHLLEAHKISQKQLAQKLQKRESEISKWLSGGHNFTQQTLTKISLVIGEPIYQIPTVVNKAADAIAQKLV
ncbi:XRE family transcriptional regulator [Pedobacter changchengzhani]|uniref:XRE family transcriptional regulator n=2 Tax=Pedobacter changchengzhani TaxID=2529274 RepID=A0A4V3A064_9SPHI|nr:XRE family transcriptional regulator [Pedobacter changchengzhani]